MNTKRIYITAPVDIEEKLEKLAKADRRSKSNYIISLIEREYDKLVNSKE